MNEWHLKTTVRLSLPRWDSQEESHGLAARGGLAPRLGTSAPRQRLQTNARTHLFPRLFLCVCVCPKPVLVKKEMIFGHKMARKGQTIALPAGTVTLKLCPFADASSIDPGPEPFGTCGRRRSETLEIKCGPKRKDGGAKGSRN
jgi:hypothetical protein